MPRRAPSMPGSTWRASAGRRGGGNRPADPPADRRGARAPQPARRPRAVRDRRHRRPRARARARPRRRRRHGDRPAPARRGRPMGHRPSGARHRPPRRRGVPGRRRRRPPYPELLLCVTGDTLLERRPSCARPSPRSAAAISGGRQRPGSRAGHPTRADVRARVLVDPPSVVSRGRVARELRAVLADGSTSRPTRRAARRGAGSPGRTRRCRPGR